MTNFLKQSKALSLSIALAAGMTGLAFAQTSASQSNNAANTEQTNSYNSSYSQATVRSAQQQLKNDGYYTGKIDGEDGPMTQSAIRKYQQNQNITVNGRLDQQTLNKLGVQKQ